MFKPQSVPWNKGKSVGARQAFTAHEIRTLVRYFEQTRNYRELALMTVAVDSMLRVSDLLQLRTSDMLDSFGKPKTTLRLKQQKTQSPVIATLTKTALQALTRWIEASGKTPNDFLFTSLRSGYTDQSLSDSALRRMIKQWAADILGLDPSQYSVHSLRRTKPTFMYQCGVAIEHIALLLGHKDVKSTLRYLGIDQHQAHQEALDHDIFNPQKTATTKSTVRLSASQLDKLASLIVQKMSMGSPHD